MARLSTSLLTVLVAVATSALLLAAPAMGQGCPFTPQEAEMLDFSVIVGPCGPSLPIPARCEPCACALVEAFNPLVALRPEAFVAAPGTTTEQAQAVLNQCAPSFFGPFSKAGVNVNALMELQQCPTDAPIPACVPDEFRPIIANFIAG